ncbi:hypothetical protein L1277_001123 [Okibacterium sp. HSC-33S16]|uniref:hypothetical protein n=1 Tax=Okibacterium sp. HSC-33S16 TaxID=2910965 RepID=UPI0020A03F88|nr:hypothetical protein [Okibacterium sp. HSC-33S16]MCP2031032.1 hypothetical protein [Okibacterium sp. HSC-33S16]
MIAAGENRDEPEITDAQNPVSDEAAEARRRERLQAREDEAIEAEHIDNFLAGGSYDEF